MTKDEMKIAVSYRSMLFKELLLCGVPLDQLSLTRMSVNWAASVLSTLNHCMLGYKMAAFKFQLGFLKSVKILLNFSK